MTETDAPRILILEDDAVLAELMANVLIDAGYLPDVAASPEAAQGTYDLIVADYLAPAFVRGQAWPHLAELRTLSQGHPILGCTGHRDALEEPAANFGVQAVTLKPFDVDELLQQIGALLSRANASAPAAAAQ